MKKSILFASAVLVLLSGSCGNKSETEKKDEAPTVCDCVKLGEKLMAEMEAIGGDETKMREIEDKYKDQIESCKKLGEGLSEEEKKKMAEEARNCR